MNPLNTISKCPVCGANEILDYKSKQWHLHACCDCNHVFSRDNQIAENLHFEGEDYRNWRANNTHLLRTRARRRMALVDRFLEIRQGRAFEIGCSTGESLNVLADAGWQSFGVDLSAAAVSLCREFHPNVNVAVGTDVMDLDVTEKSPFDLVMAFHVVEHIADLSTLAKRLGDYCREGSILYLSVPNWGSWSRGVMGDDWPDLMPEHIHYFSQSSMQRWLAQSGFEPIHVETGSAAWPWLGGIKRKFKRRFRSPSSTAKRSTPGRGSMALLRLGNIILWPLLKIESVLGAGNELRVVARYRPSAAEIQAQKS